MSMVNADVPPVMLACASEAAAAAGPADAPGHSVGPAIDFELAREIRAMVDFEPSPIAPPFTRGIAEYKNRGR